MRIDSIRQLASRQIQVDWIVENFISPGGWTFLIGETKVGKSMLSIQLVDCLQEGRDFLGMKTRKHNCLYVQADAGSFEWQLQLQRLAPESKAWTVYEMEGGWLDNAGRRQQLHDIVWGTYPIDDRSGSLHNTLKHIPFTFVIFDCLHAITNRDINTKPEGNMILNCLDEIVTQVVDIREDGSNIIQRVHYVLIHHPNAMVKRGAISGAGWKGFSALCSTKLNLVVNGKEGGAILYLDGSKVTSKKELLLERDKDTGGWLLEGQGLAALDEDLYSHLL